VSRVGDPISPTNDAPMPLERIVIFRPRTILTIIGITLLAAVCIWLTWLAWHVITWILIAAFLSAALNPAVQFLQRHGLGRGLASGIVFLLAIAAIGGIGALVIPPLVDQVSKFIEAVPDIVSDVTAGRGPLGFLETDYEITERIRSAIREQGPGGVLGLTGPVVGVAQSVLTAVAGVVTVAFLTLFMLLEGPRTVDRFLELVPERSRPRWERVSGNIYRTVGGYVTGNLAISLIAGVVSTIVLFAVGSGYAVALGVVVAVLDLIPLAGATIAAVVVTTVAAVELGWVRAVIVGVFFIVYQQLENHVLQPLIYGRTVQLSPLTVLIAVLIGAELAGILGALAAIPIAGSLQAIFREVLRYRRESLVEAPPGTTLALPPQRE
jgi:predicted PurR-regulated permease PerM